MNDTIPTPKNPINEDSLEPKMKTETLAEEKTDMTDHKEAVTAPDPFDPAQFAASSTVIGDVGVIKDLITCPVRKPNRQEFVRTHPGEGYKLLAHILVLKQENETYLVMPAVAAALPGETNLVTLRLAVSRQGAVFLWPVPEPRLDGRENAWHASARAAAARAETDWVKIVANMAQGSYDLYVASGALGSPVWPDKSLRDILAIAFGENFIIRSHPVISHVSIQHSRVNTAHRDFSKDALKCWADRNSPSKKNIILMRIL